MRDTGSQRRNEFQSRFAVGSESGGQPVRDNQKRSAATGEVDGQQFLVNHRWPAVDLASVLTELKDRTRIYRGNLKPRVALANNIKAKQKAAAVYRMREAGEPLPAGRFPPVTAADIVLVQETYPELIAAELALKRACRLHERRLELLAARLPVADWWCSHRGRGAATLGQIAGEIGDLNRFKLYELYKWFGLHVDENGRAPKPEKGKKLGYSKSRHTLAILIAHGVIISTKKGGNESDRAFFDQKRALYGERCETALHAHNSARRLLAKHLLKELWQAWRAATDDLQPKFILPLASSSEKHDEPTRLLPGLGDCSGGVASGGIIRRRCART